MGWSGPQVCVSAPLPHGRSWCRGMVVDGLGECPGIAYFTPKFGLEMYEKESGLSGEGIEGVCVPPLCCPCPFGSFLWVCPQKEGGQGRGKQSWSEPCRCGVSLGTLRCPTAARLGGLGGHNSFLGCEDPLALPGGFGQAHSPSSTTRSMHLPSLLPRLGGVGASLPPSWPGFEFGAQEGFTHPTAKLLQHAAVGRQTPSPPCIWDAHFEIEDQGWPNGVPEGHSQ